MPSKNFGLFLDAGIAHCGVVVYDLGNKRIAHMTCFRTEKRGEERLAAENIRRCKEMSYQLEKIAEKFNVKLVCAELPHGGAKSARAMSAMSMAAAVIGCFVAFSKLPFFPVTPNEIKRLVSKRGSVEKKAVQDLVEKRFAIHLPSKLEIREHIGDACAAILVAEKKFNVKFQQWST